MSCFDFHYPSTVFRIVGVNTDECNLGTVEGVLWRFRFALVRAIKEACNTDSGHPDPWSKYPTVPNLAISSESIDAPTAEPAKAEESAAA
jgi:hypothetical protein